jgi:predicted MPP superfamily phosphohydrolase
VELTLSGHTHYGQIAIPRLGWSLASAFLEHSMGRYQKDGSQLYINPGTNYWGIPFRLGTPPEVTVITLRRAGGRAALRERTRRNTLPEVMPSHP